MLKYILWYTVCTAAVFRPEIKKLENISLFILFLDLTVLNFVLSCVYT